MFYGELFLCLSKRRLGSTEEKWRMFTMAYCSENTTEKCTEKRGTMCCKERLKIQAIKRFLFETVVKIQGDNQLFSVLRIFVFFLFDDRIFHKFSEFFWPFWRGSSFVAPFVEANYWYNSLSIATPRRKPRTLFVWQSQQKLFVVKVWKRNPDWSFC